MEIESEKKDKDIKETQNDKEIERLNRKLKRVMEEYAKCAKERDELRAAINVAKRKKGRPGLSTEKKAQICTLYQQGNSMRQTAQKAGVSLGTVSNVIDEAKKSSRIVYVYMDRKKPATLLDIYPAINRLEIWNFTDDLISRAFGSREKPSWQEYEQFLEDRCMPRTRPRGRATVTVGAGQLRSISDCGDNKGARIWRRAMVSANGSKRNRSN